MTVTVGFLLGSGPSGASVLSLVAEHLRRAGAEVPTRVVGPAEVGVPEELHRADVVALRDLGPAGSSVAHRLEAAGVRCCNRAAATALTTRKEAVVTALAAAGVAVPPGVVVPTWADARLLGARGPVVAKALDGRGGTGVVLAERGGLAERAPFPGPYLVQERLAHDGPDRKVFVIGHRVWGVLRPWPPTGLADKRGQPFDPTPDEVAVAVASGAALGLEVFGVDLVPTGEGPVVVDVNAFPGFKGVEGAAAALAAHLLSLARCGAWP